MIKKLLSIVVFVSLILTGLSIAINNPIDPKKAKAAPISVPPKPTMNDYWNGTAEFKLYNEMKTNNKNDWQPNSNPALDGWFDAGTRIIDNGGTWYWIGRGAPGSNCPGRSDPIMYVTLRKSIDKGQTWSAPINPLPITSHSDCHATDGSIYWDQANNRWVMLYQCLGSGNNYKWQGCLAFRNNSDPFGAFVPYTNPVFNGSSIGNALCATNYDCGNGGFHPFGIGLNYFIDEGTFDIIGKIGNDYTISAHMYITNGNRSGEGIRIIMKSTDWVNWRVGDNGQRFPILDKSLQPAMLENWTDGAKGFGHGDSLQESGYTYQVSEAVSKGLLCQGNQKWDFTLQRIPTNAINANANWEMYGKNPITYSSSQLLPSTGQTSPCNPGYAGMFKDNQDFTYYYLSRTDEINNGIEMYQLQWKRNIIQNGDFLRGQINNWSYAGVSGSISRNHLDASDNNFALKVDVNNPSLNGSVYAINQTPVIPSYVGQTYQQTVKVKSTVAMNGMLRFVQVDSAGNWLSSQDKNFSSNTNYKEIVQNGITILPNAVTIYTIVYPIGNGTMYVDEAGMEQNTLKQSNINYCTTPIKIMTIGDSNTDGGANAYDGYRPHLWNKMQIAGNTIDMVGSKNNNNNVNNFPNYDGDHDGRGAHSSLMSKSFLINNQTANVTKPDFLLLMSGTVDVIYGSSTNEAIVYYEELVKEFHLQSPSTKIIATKIVPIYNYFYGVGTNININIDANVFNNRLSVLILSLQAQGIPITLLDQVNLLSSEFLSSDGVHPNDVGAEKVANNFYQSLRTNQELQTQRMFCPNQYLISANSSSQAAVVSSTNQATVSSQNAFNSSSNQGLSSQNQANSSQVAFTSTQTALSSNNALSSITNQISSQNQANSSQQVFQNSNANQISSNNANSSQVANSSLQVFQSSQNAFNSITTANSSLNNANSSQVAFISTQTANSSQQAFQSSQIAQSSTANQIVSNSNQAFSSQAAQSSQNAFNSSSNQGLSSQNQANSSQTALSSQNTFNSSTTANSSLNQANSSQQVFVSSNNALSSIANQTSSNNANSSQVAFVSAQTANSSQQAFQSSQIGQSSQNAFNSITTANSSLNNANSSFQTAFNSQTALSSQNAFNSSQVAFNSSSNQAIASNSSQVSSIAISSQNSSVSQNSSLISSSNSSPQISSQNSSIVSSSPDSSQNISSTSTCQIVVPLNDPCPNGGSSSANISSVNSSANSSQNSSLVLSVAISSQAFSSQNSSVNSSVISSSNSSIISNISSQNISSVQSQSSIIPSSQNVVSSQVSSQNSSIISSTNSSVISSLIISSQVSSLISSITNSSLGNSSIVSSQNSSVISVSNSTIVSSLTSSNSSQNSSQNVVSSQVSSLVSSQMSSDNSSMVFSSNSSSQSSSISPITTLISPITDVISSIVRTITNIFNPPQLKQSIKNPTGLALEDPYECGVKVFGSIGSTTGQLVNLKLVFRQNGIIQKTYQQSIINGYWEQNLADLPFGDYQYEVIASSAGLSASESFQVNHKSLLDCQKKSNPSGLPQSISPIYSQPNPQLNINIVNNNFNTNNIPNINQNTSNSIVNLTNNINNQQALDQSNSSQNANGKGQNRTVRTGGWQANSLVGIICLAFMSIFWIASKKARL